MTLFFNRTFCILIGSLLMGSSFYSQVLNKKISETKLNIAVLDKKKDSLTQLLEQLELANGKLEIKSFSIPELKPNEDLIEHHGMLLVYSEKHEQAKWVAHKISTNIIMYIPKTKCLRYDNRLSHANVKRTAISCHCNVH